MDAVREAIEAAIAARQRPQPAATPASPAERLAQLQALLDVGAITADEYAAQRARIIGDI